MKRPASSVTRRRFCRLVAFAPLALPVAAWGQGAEADAATLYLQGVALLHHGHWFEKSAVLLARAAAREPTNSDYVLALGCAYASRLAALARAASFTRYFAQEQETYPERVRQWQANRAWVQAHHPEAVLPVDRDASRPVKRSAPIFPTKDDNRPYHLTPVQLTARVGELAAQAQAAWAKGVALSQTPAQKAHAYYLRGWGRRVLQNFLACVPETKIPAPADAEIRADFDQAIALDPANALYWQAKADALGDDPAAVPLYEKAAALVPRHVNLWYGLYERTLDGKGDTTNEKRSVSQRYLQQAQAHDRGNAWPCYKEAALLFREARYDLTGPSARFDATPAQREASRAAVRGEATRRKGQRAIDLLGRGNHLPRYEFPVYRDSVPGLLEVVWRYGFALNHRTDPPFLIRELARSGVGYGQFMADENNPAEGVRACRAVADMGYRLIGNWPLGDGIAMGDTAMTVAMGMGTCLSGFQYLLTIYNTLGDSAAADQVVAERDALNKRYAEYRKAYAAKISTLIAQPELGY